MTMSFRDRNDAALQGVDGLEGVLDVVPGVQRRSAHFGSLGPFYRSCPQIEDDEVVACFVASLGVQGFAGQAEYPGSDGRDADFASF